MHYISSIPAKSAEITHTLKKVSPKKISPKKEIVLTLRSAKMLVTRFGEMYHCIISGSSAVNGCRQNESPNRLKHPNN